jgi:hypothetical protein
MRGRWAALRSAESRAQGLSQPGLKSSSTLKFVLTLSLSKGEDARPASPVPSLKTRP